MSSVDPLVVARRGQRIDVEVLEAGEQREVLVDLRVADGDESRARQALPGGGLMVPVADEVDVMPAASRTWRWYAPVPSEALPMT